jgi:hypothetical protein
MGEGPAETLYDTADVMISLSANGIGNIKSNNQMSNTKAQSTLQYSGMKSTAKRLFSSGYRH